MTSKNFFLFLIKLPVMLLKNIVHLKKNYYDNLNQTSTNIQIGDACVD